MSSVPERGPGLGLREMVRYALSDLRFRPGMTLLNVLSVAVAVIYLLLLSYYGQALYRFQRSLVDQALLTRLSARCPDAVNLEQRFTPALLEEVRAQPGVRLAFPRVEVGVRASLKQGPWLNVSAEGTVPGDAVLAPARLRQGRAIAREDVHEVVVPISLFEKLGGKVSEGQFEPGELRLEVKRTVSGQNETQTLVLPIVGLLSAGTEDRAYLPLALAEHLDQWCAHRIARLPGPGGKPELPRLACTSVRAYGPTDQRHRVAQEARELNVDVRPTGTLTLVEADGDIWVQVQGDQAGKRLATALAGAHAQASLVRAGVPEVRQGAAAPEWTVQVPPIHYRRLMEALNKAGLIGRPLTPVRETALTSYEAVPREKAAKRDAADVSAALEMAQPTFLSALPVVRVGAAIGDMPLSLMGSTPADPGRFQADVRHGGWLEGTGREVVLPAEVAQKLFPGPAGAWEGREVEVRFVRERGAHQGDATLTLSCRVVGVTAGRTGFAPLELVQGVALWDQGKVIWNEGIGAFEAPAEVHRRGGHLRCNIDLGDTRSAGEMVRWLEARGYRVEHRLGEQEALGKLARVLVCVVLLFVVGFATCAGITVLISNALHLASKTHEIGILRAHGVSRGQIVGLFAIQGLLCALAAFVLGGGLTVGLAPLTSEVVRSTFRLPPEALAVRLTSLSHAWLFGSALVLAVLATTVGAVLPALRASRLGPVEAMQRVD